MTTVPPAVTVWPTLADERLILMTPPSSELANQRTVRALVHRIRELETYIRDEDMRHAFDAEVVEEARRTLAKLPCMHEPGHHDATPPMMWPELIHCIAAKAQHSATKPLTKAQVEEAAEKLFLCSSGVIIPFVDRRPEWARNQTLPDVVHLLCDSFGVREWPCTNLGPAGS